MRIEKCSACGQSIRVDGNPPAVPEGSLLLRLCTACEHEAVTFFAQYWPNALHQWLSHKMREQ
jgi:hypothetical protein